LAPDRASLGARPLLLAISTGDVEYKDLLAHYHELCQRLGPLPPPRVVDVDHGAQRFLLFALQARASPGACTTPAMAWVDTPVPGARVRSEERRVGREWGARWARARATRR